MGFQATTTSVQNSLVWGFLILKTEMGAVQAAR